MSIIRRGDHYKHVPPHVPHKGETRGGFTFIELFIVLGILATLTIAIYVAAASQQRVLQAQRVTSYAR